MVTMAYGLGIDLGTTFSAAAVAAEARSPELINLGGRSPAIPSVVMPRASGEILIGLPAEARATVEPSRVAREFKRRLGDPTPLILGGAPFSPQALTVILLRSILASVEQQMGGPPSSVVITHPASYSKYGWRCSATLPWKRVSRMRCSSANR